MVKLLLQTALALLDKLAGQAEYGVREAIPSTLDLIGLYEVVLEQ